MGTFPRFLLPSFPRFCKYLSLLLVPYDAASQAWPKDFQHRAYCAFVGELSPFFWARTTTTYQFLRARLNNCSHGEGARQGQDLLVIPPKPDGYATRREIFEAVDAALDAPLSEHGVEGYNLSVRDCYVDQACDGMFVTEVTEDTVTAVCDYCS